MNYPLFGYHHITACVGGAQQDVDFDMRCAGFEGRTQDGAGREQEKALAVGEQASLRALADARGPEEDEDEGLVAAGCAAEAIGHG